jgi:hypothetical protein
MFLQREGFPEVFYQVCLSKEGFLSGSGFSNPGTGYFRFFSPVFLVVPTFKFVFSFTPAFFFFLYRLFPE